MCVYADGARRLWHPMSCCWSSNAHFRILSSGSCSDISQISSQRVKTPPQYTTITSRMLSVPWYHSSGLHAQRIHFIERRGWSRHAGSSAGSERSPIGNLELQQPHAYSCRSVKQPSHNHNLLLIRKVRIEVMRAAGYNGDVVWGDMLASLDSLYLVALASNLINPK